ncbi:PREDICTED: uncharacterized protein LOC107071076 [Polistes dominula]|uniref:Uncharacterized protein LOC107071076 n=1 Tax=Polistes dominula TaxID=743375 RepID=A0ABM1IYG5_POLDO|nr:PREDICTED: uncharacterized protein LOC107071076 [Polistes dominula]
MYTITYILIGIVFICLFPLEIHSGIYDDKITLNDHLKNIGKKQSSNDINTVNICGLDNSCKNNDTTNLKNNVDNKNNKKLITHLVPPLITSKDYYTYFNRRKKELKHKNERGNRDQYNVKNNTFVKANISDSRIESDHLSYTRDHAPTHVTKVKSLKRYNYDNI